MENLVIGYVVGVVNTFALLAMVFGVRIVWPAAIVGESKE